MKGSSFIKVLLIIVALVFVFHQTVSSLYTPIKTDTAVYYTATEGFKITGLIIRGETLVSSEQSGVLHFVTKDAERVAKKGIIANIYDSEAASITVTQIEQLQSNIADIESILSYNDLDAANLDLINLRVEQRLNEFIMSASTGNYNNIISFEKELVSAVNRRQAAIGVTTGLNEHLTALKAELSELSKKLPTAKEQIFSDKSGYFVSKTDGYENVLSSNDLSVITPEFLDSVSPEEHSQNVIGKIVSDYEWYIAAEVSINESLNYKEGEVLKIQTAVKTSPTLSVTVKRVNISESSERAVIIFSCDQMNSELAVMRSGPMTVVRNEYSGLKIPKKALRVVDSERGVYVVSGMQVKFVPVDIVYNTESYIICEKKNENGNVLKLYDMVVVKGKGLYDGKIIS